jgi:predicted ATP-grasp superfamily ATP-dependent carboligase
MCQHWLLCYRAPIVRGGGKAFSEELLKWARSVGFERVVVLSGGDRSLMEPDPNPLRFVSTAEEVRR